MKIFYLKKIVLYNIAITDINEDLRKDEQFTVTY